MKVHTTLGAGFLEAVYQEALADEFSKAKIPFQQQVKLPIYYGNKKLNKYYKADFICYDKIVLEIKAAKLMPNAFYRQLNYYLRAINKKLGLLVNFGSSSLNYKRIINSQYSQ